MRLAVPVARIVARIVATLTATLAWSAAAPAGASQAIQFSPVLPQIGPGGQPLTPPKGTGLILGQVVDGTTGKPVGGVLVTMNLNAQVTASRGAGSGAGGGTPVPPQGRGAAAGGVATGGGAAPQTPVVNVSTTQRVLTDGEGHFLFHDLPRASVSLNAQAPGYTSGSYGQRRPNGPGRSIDLADGQRISDAVLRVWKVASISGSILDEAGEPLVSVQVQAMRLVVSGGQRRYNLTNSTQTDDRGMYHFSVQMGDYIILVPNTTTVVPASSIAAYQQAISTPGNAASEYMRDLTISGAPIPSGSGYRVGDMQLQQNGMLSRAQPPPTDGSRLMIYQTTFYPAATVLPQAQMISLGSGEERQGVDIAMRLVGTSRVTGIVTGSDAVGSLGVRLSLAENGDAPGLDTQIPAANTLTEASGAFTFLGVPPGQYVLRITKVPRPIFDGSPNGPDLTQAPTYWAQMPVAVGESDVIGLPVALRSGVKLSGRVEFDGSSPRPLPQRLLAAQMNVVDVEGRASVSPVRFTPEGTFVTQGLLPGRYLLSAAAPGAPWVLKSITVNGKDASAMPLTVDNDVSGVILTYTDHPTSIDVTVHTDSSGPDNSTSVVVFPANYQAWLAAGTTGRASRFNPYSPNSTLTLTNLPPGDYLIAAVPTELQSDWQDPKTLEAIARGASRLLLSDGEHRTVELRPLVVK